MSVRIRLARAGAKRAPFYRVVVADARSPRDGRFIEIVGRYNPRTEPSTFIIDVAKIDSWVAKGAVMSDTVVKLVALARDDEAKTPQKVSKPSKKAQAKSAAEQEATASAQVEPATADVTIESADASAE